MSCRRWRLLASEQAGWARLLPPAGWAPLPPPGGRVPARGSFGARSPALPSPLPLSPPAQGDHRVPRACLVDRAPLVARTGYDTVLADYMPPVERLELASMRSHLAGGVQDWLRALASTLQLHNGTGEGGDSWARKRGGRAW